jgi:hypothetical protein
MAKRTLYQRLRDIDRRFIFLFIALSVVIPLLFKLYFPESATPMTEGVFAAVENLPDGSRVLIDFSYDPATLPELEPMAAAWLRHCFLKKHKVYIVALWPLGPQLAADSLREVTDSLRQIDPERRIVYGEDYVNLGYKSGYQGVIKVLLTNFGALYATDVNGTNTADISMMNGVVNLKSFDLIISLSAGYPGVKEWIQFGGVPSGVPLISGTTAVYAPLLYPYYPGQLVGLLGGMKGAAEYEALLFDKIKDRLRARLHAVPELRRTESDHLLADPTLDPAVKEKRLAAINEELKDLAALDVAHATDRELVRAAEQHLGYAQKGILRMGPQAIAHLVIILFIVIGNITFFIDKRRARR